MKKIVTLTLLLLLVFISTNSYSQAVEYKSITQEEFSEMYEISFVSDTPNKATYLYDDFKSEIIINDKKLLKPESSIYMHVVRGTGSVALDISVDGYNHFIRVLIDDKDKVKKTKFHYKYECIIEYSKLNGGSPLLKRGYMMSRYQLRNLCTGNISNLNALPSDLSEYYKVMDLTIYSIEEEVAITIDKIKK